MPLVFAVIELTTHYTSRNDLHVQSYDIITNDGISCCICSSEKLESVS
jgi:hypothetical protein